jgi:hypothetical protein
MLEKDRLQNLSLWTRVPLHLSVGSPRQLAPSPAQKRTAAGRSGW